MNHWRVQVDFSRSWAESSAVPWRIYVDCVEVLDREGLDAVAAEFNAPDANGEPVAAFAFRGPADAQNAVAFLAHVEGLGHGDVELVEPETDEANGNDDGEGTDEADGDGMRRCELCDKPLSPRTPFGEERCAHCARWGP